MNALPELSVLLPFALAVVVIAVTPGPDMTLFVGRALSQGRTAGLACMAGAMTGIMIHTLLVALGLSALLAASPQAFFALKMFGAAYLLWLAVQAIRHGSAFSPQTGARPALSPLRNWVTGVGINLLNPKVVLFFVTFLPQFVSANDPDAAQKLVALGLVFIAVSLPVSLAIVLAADAFAGFVRRAPRLMRMIDYLFAGIFAAFALRMLATETTR